MSTGSVKLFIATPCYGGMLTVAFFTSMLGLVTELNKHNIKAKIKPIANESLITRARNCLFSEFINSPEQYTHLLFIDADIGFHPSDVIKLLSHNKDFVGGTYPHKNIQWGTVARLMQTNKDKSIKEIETISNNYSVDLETRKDQAGNTTIDMRGDLVQCKYIPTGFMLIKREVGEKLIMCNPSDYYYNDMSGYSNGKEKIWNFFNCFVCQDQQRYLSEDYAFCKRWKDCGGEIWLDSSLELVHMGTYSFNGCYKDRLTNNLK